MKIQNSKFNTKNYYAIIMAGGIGSRFWPMSTSDYPKQFHDMLGVGESLLQRTFNRFAKLIPKENILISTNKNYKELVLEQLPTINEKQLLLEPIMRNTAPCILYASLKINDLNKNAVIVVAPSDHWIDDEPEFLKNVTTAFKACAKKDILMTLGIQPSNPNTGYGYIKYNASTGSAADTEINSVLNFTEKPNLEKAKQFIKEGNYLWNAGIFVWSTQSIIKSYKEYLPEMEKLFCCGNKVWNTDFEDDFIEDNYKNAESISIDFGILEKAKNVHVLPVEFGWNDLGTWGSLYEKLPKDSKENAVVNAETIFRNASNNIVRTTKGKHVVIQGLDNFIVVEKDDVLLICPKDKEQDIKEIVAEVKEKFKRKLT